MLPFDILVNIIEYVDDPKDLLSFALTSSAMHTEIVPRHIDYRRILCRISFIELIHIWEHLLDTPYACSRIRYLDVASSEMKIPRMCKIISIPNTSVSDQTYTSPVFLRALSKMNNLLVLKLDAPTDRDLCSISEAIGEANCAPYLEELDICVEVVRRETVIDQYFKENKISNDIGERSPLFYGHLSSLRKYTLRVQYGTASSRNTMHNVFLQMLFNAPNLTHMNVSTLRSPALLLGHWPNLQHLVLPYLVTPQGATDLEKGYIYYFRTFLRRHSKLVTFSTDGAIRPGWANEWDDFLPNLRSLAFSSYPSPSVPIIPTRIAERLTHLRMTIELHSVFVDREIVLSNLETCIYMYANLGVSVRDLATVIPNIKKLHIIFAFTERNVFRSLGSITADEIARCLPFLAKLRYLRVLSGPFSGGSVSVYDNPLPGLLYEFPSLSYVWGSLNKDKRTNECLRLVRDDVAQTTRFERTKDECGAWLWGGFYRNDNPRSSQFF